MTQFVQKCGQQQLNGDEFFVLVADTQTDAVSGELGGHTLHGGRVAPLADGDLRKTMEVPQVEAVAGGQLVAEEEEFDRQLVGWRDGCQHGRLLGNRCGKLGVL